ncbi:MAG TPA: peptidylprolyl isomerase [Polyangia bacterium]|nr:peptidylprolyl isomerase [Polyangia bacterium]
MRLLIAALGLVFLGCAHTLSPRDEIARLEDQRAGADRLMTLAGSGDAALRRRALRVLARLQDPATLPALERALGDSDPTVQDEAAFAVETLGLRWEGLDEMPRQRAEQAVLRALAAAPAPRQVALLRALGTVAGEEGARQLVERLSSAEPRVAEAAALALGTWIHRNPHPATAAATAWPGPGTAHLSSEATRDPAARRALAYALMRAAAQKKDASLGVALLAGLADDDAEVRALSAKGLAALAPLGEGEPAERLGQLATTDPDWRVRVEAVRALAAASAKSHAAAEQLERALLALVRDAVAAPARPDPRPLMPLWAAWDPAIPYASGTTAERALPLLEEARKAASGPHRLDLARLACAAAAARDRAVRTIDALHRCGGDSIAPRERDRRVARTLGAIPDAASVEALSILLVSVDPGTRSQAAESLGQIAAALEKTSPSPESARRARALLRAALRDTDGPVVATAAEALGHLMDTESAPGLLDALTRFARPTDNEITQSLIEALGAVRAPSAAPALRPLLASSIPPVRLATRKALAALGDTTPASGPVASPEPLPAAARAPGGQGPAARRRLHLSTDKGDIVILLATEEAPVTTAALARLVARRFYDGLTFHRVVPDFVAQGGDPRGDGWGGPGYNLRCELHPRRYLRGTVGMALAGKDTGGSQFFVTHSMQPHLDGKYTVIGEVETGMDVVDALLPGDRILRATLSR